MNECKFLKKISAWSLGLRVKQVGDGNIDGNGSATTLQWEFNKYLVGTFINKVQTSDFLSLKSNSKQNYGRENIMYLFQSSNE